MADLTSLVAGGAKSLLRDKASEYMSPQQMEFARFALSPQAYLADKGIAAVANLLGYGNQYQELKAGAQGQKEYGKEVARDAIGDALPGTLGDFVRATPKMTDADYNASMEELRQSTNTPEAIAQFNAGFNPDSQYNINSQNYVGPQDPRSINSDVYWDNVKALYEMLGQYKQPAFSTNDANTDSNMAPLGYVFDPATGTVVPDDYGTQAGPGYQFDPNTGTAVPIDDMQAGPGYRFDQNTGTAVPINDDMLASMDYGDMFGGGMEQADDFGKYGLGVSDFGGGGAKSLEQFDMAGYKHGGQICGCKR